MRLYRNYILAVLLLLPSSSWARRESVGEQEIAELKRVQETNSKTLADNVQAVSTIQQDLQALKGAIEENKHFFEEESQKNEKLLKDFDLRISAMEEKLGLFESQVQELGAKGGPVAKGTTAAAAGAEDDLYRKALAEINAQNYKGVIPLFDQFLKKYPKSNMADNAQYWKGEALYALKQFPEAVLEFQKVVKRYPKSDKVAASVLKQGYCFFEAKEYLDAKAFLQKVATDFPKSEEAIKAKDKMRQVDQVLAKKPISAPPPR